MQRSKSYALLFLLAAFIAGAALGYTADRVLTNKHGRGERPSRDRMARELGLSPAQRAQFDSIMNARRTQMRELFSPIRPQMDSLQKIAKAMGDTTHEQLKKILTPEQAKKLDEMRDRMRKREAASRARADSERARTPGPK
ncbi:MAG TPA: Spy/CpxP family protein refolding chaperone [Gemmatimonadaceae bacterium]|nr:Spy/CpxP family protein refolding chaperone [Gemmatimonadaceae bacterium]